MISKSTQNLLKRWRAKKELRDRGITNLNTPDYYNLVSEEVKKIEAGEPISDILELAKDARFKLGRDEQIIASLDDDDTVRLE